MYNVELYSTSRHFKASHQVRSETFWHAYWRCIYGFYSIYFQYIKSLLTTKLNQFRISHGTNYNYVFAGYSIGGSIATLAALDLKRNKLVSKPLVYTYGALRLGDASFVALVNTYVRVWRIVKSTDYVIRTPNCYSANGVLWQCYQKSSVTVTTFPLRTYLTGYVAYYTVQNPVLTRAIIYASRKKAGNSTTVKGLKKLQKKAAVKKS